ncbi:hypothetical protein I5J36_gp32 [Mycobacterium phage Mendokysei]|uniref:Uncharacterized protein n=1 Tax=Mycobacterium phage Mendokysei TaxID=2099637 RepID=A0A2P1CGD0_9CAUD|nr:hypothetical protein I5J36_gp32 [Mycobacterium phage Mendokysei]AVJ50249.1 hypothetical protein SEA_MENDOKYSEI_32 [Mycobacterium phage Mendokysei]
MLRISICSSAAATKHASLRPIPRGIRGNDMLNVSCEYAC